jgi:F-box-like
MTTLFCNSLTTKGKPCKSRGVRQGFCAAHFGLERNAFDLLGQVPEEICIMIAFKLPVRAVSQLSLVSHEWYERCRTSYLWRELIARDFGQRAELVDTVSSPELYRSLPKIIVKELITEAFNVYIAWRRLPTEERKRNDPAAEQLRILSKTLSLLPATLTDSFEEPLVNHLLGLDTLPPSPHDEFAVGSGTTEEDLRLASNPPAPNETWHSAKSRSMIFKQDQFARKREKLRAKRKFARIHTLLYKAEYMYLTELVKGRVWSKLIRYITFPLKGEVMRCHLQHLLNIFVSNSFADNLDEGAVQLIFGWLGKCGSKIEHESNRDAFFKVGRYSFEQSRWTESIREIFEKYRYTH